MTFPSRLMGAHFAALQAREVIGNPVTALTATGSSVTDALQLSASINVIATTAASTGVKLPPCEAGAMVVVENRGAQTLTVYPNGTNTIDATTSASIATSRGAIFFGTGNDWVFIYGA